MILIDQRWLRVIGVALLLGACEQPKQDDNHKNESKAVTINPKQQTDSASVFPGIEGSELYDLANAKLVFGRYLLVPANPNDEYSYFTSIFYRSSPDSIWRKIDGFRLDYYNMNTKAYDAGIDTVNIDKQGPAELIVRSYWEHYGTGGGSSCHTLSIFRCEKEVVKVLEVPVLYSDELFITFQGGRADYRYISQSVRPQRGRIKVGKVEKQRMECEEPADCEDCVPHLKPGVYKLIGDTVVRVSS